MVQLVSDLDGKGEAAIRLSHCSTWCKDTEGYSSYTASQGETASLKVLPRPIPAILCFGGGGVWLFLLEATNFSVVTVALGLLVALAVIK
jgi:hypothetical protein